MSEAILVLEDGRTFTGDAYGARGETVGEAVFATGMTGYQETLTDPSYHRQVVVQTAPHIGNTGVNDEDAESQRIWVAGYVVRDPSRRTSSWRSRRSLHDELAAQDIVGISGIDTRALTRHLRERGAMRCGVSSAGADRETLLRRVLQSPPMTGADLSAQVSTSEPYAVEAIGPHRFTVAALDYGIKTMTPHRMAERGITTHVLPSWATFADVQATGADAVFLANGPGDPATADDAVATVRDVLRAGLPLFGICFGNQVLGRAFGFGTYKLGYGHRGINQPVQDRATGRVEITAHNHGFAVDAPLDRATQTPLGDVEVSHVGLNDGVVEGLRARDVPAFSVQYHPEAAAGPHDARLPLRPVSPPCSKAHDDLPAYRARRRTRRSKIHDGCRNGHRNRHHSEHRHRHEHRGRPLMPRRTDIEHILVIGSGPIVIGQACEFDYSGTQACRVLRDEGFRVSLINSNPATIMTDPEFADATYIEPLTPEYVEKVIARERPDALLATLGGQTALNLAVALHQNGALARYGVELIGADIEAIQRGEDRQRFKEIVRTVGGQVPASLVCRSLDEAMAFAATVDHRIVVRPSFTMGGLGSGLARDPGEVRTMVGRGLAASPVHEVLVEQSVVGWKEFELELMRDRNDNVVVVCSIENVDPMGVHTGDSITVAPAMTLTDREYQHMRDVGIAVLREVGVDTGGCNIQFAVNPADGQLIVIEMNPRVSRSSALASKATGFPIAKIAAKLAVGYTLDEIPNDITRETPAAFEPALDYVVIKVPRFRVREVPRCRPGPHHAHEERGRGHGDRPQLRRGARQGAALDRDEDGRILDQPRPCPSPRRPARRDCHTHRGTALPRRTGPASGAVGRRGRRAVRHRSLVHRPDRPDDRTAGGDRRRAGIDARAAAAGQAPWSVRPAAGRLAPGARGRGRCAAVALASGHPARLQDRRHLRGGVRGRHAVPLLVLRRADGGGPAARPAEGDHPGQWTQPHRAGHRVRLLVRARRHGAAGGWLRDGDGQLQPGDRLHRLRHVRPPVLRAADLRGRARGGVRRAGVRAGGRRYLHARRADSSGACPAAQGRRHPGTRYAAGGDRPGRASRRVRSGAGPGRAACSQARHGGLLRAGQGGGRRNRLPGPGTAVLRAGWPRDGDRLRRGHARVLHRPGHRDHAGASRARRPVPRRRCRDRRRRALRR